jgi:hypothetical protein
MDLTIKLTKLLDGRWEASANELPNITYIDGDREKARERMEDLAHALRSPHLKIHEVDKDHGVVLKLQRDGAEPGDLVESDRDRTKVFFAAAML